MPKDEQRNALRGEREDIKAYLGLMGIDDSVMTEGHLSPRAVEEMRQTITKTLADPKRGDAGTILNHYPYSKDSTHMHHVVGKVAPSNLRVVDIGGVPYYQLLDRYDFDLGKEGQGNWVNGLAGGVAEFIKSPQNALNVDGGMISPWGPEKFAGKLGLQRNLNYLIPVDPRRVAPAEIVEAYRKQTNLPYPSQTLGGKVVNHLAPKGTREKVMP